MFIFFSTVTANKENQNESVPERQHRVVDKQRNPLILLQYKSSKGKE